MMKNGLRLNHLNRAIIASLLLTAPVAHAHAQDHSHHQHHQHGHHQHHGETLAAAAPLTKESLYQTELSWVNQHNETIELADLRGKPVIVTMIYASCNTACPVLVQDIRRIEQQLGDAAADTQVLVVSFDHENDTPERLAEFAEQQRANKDGWHFVTGSASDIRTWAALVGIRYRQNPNGGYDHSNVIGVLNAEGELVHRHEGLNRHHEKVAQVLLAL